MKRLIHKDFKSFFLKNVVTVNGCRHFAVTVTITT